ncbi:MAG: BatD family protein [Flavobacteriaceae bacterium]|nr:BatD family protein [Flavobacteriaceae bacterium]MDP4794256.1 BatD family protein [Flavobacteriaceae bacterium]MDP5112807.1 BatD family protein [Flavobacteriaceae bacterium]
MQEIRRVLLGVIALIWAAGLWAQDKDILFEVSLSKEKLGLNERLRVDFTMNRDGDHFEAPAFKGFKVLMGPSQSTSSSWVNGVRSFSRTFSFILQPTAKGSWTIGQAEITIDGTVYKTAAKKVEVTDAVAKPSDEQTAQDVADQNVRVISEVSKTNPYLNEGILITYKLLVGSGVNVTNFNSVNAAEYTHFWNQDLPVNAYNFEPTTYEGKSYQSVVLKRVLLYPQKTGKLSLKPYTFELSVDVPTNRRDFFGRPLYAPATRVASTAEITIDVKELPQENRPASFTGAVGSFDFFVTPNKTALDAGTALEIEVRVTGKGNLKLFSLPELKVPAALERYTPENKQKINNSRSGMEGSISDRYTIIPNFQGSYPIPGLEFSYFDPKAKKYVTRTTEEINIQVLGGANSAGTTNNAGVQSPAPIERAEGFRFIKLNHQLTPLASTSFIEDLNFYTLWLAPLLLLPILGWWIRFNRARGHDLGALKRKASSRMAKKYLAQAQKALKTPDSFYLALEKSFQHFLKARLSIETADMTHDTIEELLMAQGVSKEVSGRLIELLNRCAMARYSPQQISDMLEDYNRALEVLTDLDKQHKS